MRQAIIMAGGRGERFWPMSRMNSPKQLLKIIGERTMIEETVSRLNPLIPGERIWVVTNEIHAPAIRRLLPDIPSSQIIAEPAGRNTAPCIALAAYAVRRKDPEATMVVLPADHVISPKKEFHRTIRASCRAAEKHRSLVTIGIKPTFPSTGYGYIKRGRKISEENGYDFFRVDRFVEKPDQGRARRFLKSDRYTWNSGMFIWTADTILEAFRKHLPEIADKLAPAESMAARRLDHFLGKTYPQLPSVSIDYGIMEKAETVLVTSATFSWDDVGSWEALEKHLPGDRRGNRRKGKNLNVDSNNCITFSDGPMIGLVGVSDLIVVTTEDAVLVCDRKRAQDVKNLVKKLRSENKFKKYL